MQNIWWYCISIFAKEPLDKTVCNKILKFCLIIIIVSTVYILGFYIQIDRVGSRKNEMVGVLGHDSAL